MSKSDNTKDNKKISLEKSWDNLELSHKIESVAGKDSSASRNNDVINMLLVEGIRPVLFDWNVETGKCTKSDSASEYVLFDSSIPDIFSNRVSADAVL